MSHQHEQAERTSSATTAPPAPAATGGTAPPALPPGEPGRSLRHSVWDGCAHAVMLGCGEAYLAAFAIFLGAGALELGLLASLPLLAAALAQLLTVALLDRLSRRRPLVLAPALAQALAWAPMAALPLALPACGPWLLLGTALLYFALGGLIAPAWNSWIGDLVPPAERGSWFGHRDRLRTICQLGALLAGGGMLAAGRRLGMEAAGFAAAFGTALLARLVSSWHLARQFEPPYRPPVHTERFGFREFLRRARDPQSNFGRFAHYQAALMVATHLAAPFFSLYMLRDLGFNYVEFTAAATAMVLAQVLVLRSWGRLADRFGSRRILAVCGLVVSLTPWLWLISPRLEAVLCYQVVSGVGWAGFNLAAANFLFDSVSPPKRARCVAYSSILTHAGVLAGALLGGVLAPLVPQRIALGGWELELRSPLLVLFALSGALRLAVSLYYLPRIREVRPGVEPSTHWQVIYHVTGLAAIRGLRFSIFTGNGGPARTQNHHSA